ncbi:MAG: EVE domain-containing protein [bacterium]|nr:EVE domain-containing protein [bacterium]
MPQKWLIKSEPSKYSIEDLKRDKKTLWHGVRNYQARNLLRDQWKVGDILLFYHSNAEPTGIFGIGKVSKIGVADPTQFDSKSDYFDPKASKETPRWFAPEVSYIEKFSQPITLDDLKNEKSLKDMAVLKKGNRLSVQPVSEDEFKIISKMAR